MKTRTYKRIIYGAIAFSCVIAVQFGTFNFESIGSSSGIIQSTTLWQIPFTEVTYFTSRHERETLLSKVIARNDLFSMREQVWIFSNGGGNGVMCAIGEGRHLRSAVYFPEVAFFVDAVAKYRGKSIAQAWLKLILNPKQSTGVTNAIRSGEIPAAGFSDKAAFDRWWRDHQQSFSLMLDEPDGVIMD